jgi:hypothetical protein
MRGSGRGSAFRTILVAHVLLIAVAGCGGGGNKPPDADNDGVADSADCAPQLSQFWQLLSFSSVDEDGDSFRVNAGGQVCTGASLPANRSATAVTGDGVDCTDSDAARWSMRTYAAIDEDRDGFGVAQSGQICAGAQLPAGLISALPATEDLDCDDADVDKWRLLSFTSRDHDRDGYAIADAGTSCGQGTLPAQLSALSTPPELADCDDADASRWRVVPAYRDADGDGVGSGSASRACIGTAPLTGYALTGYDPNDDPNDPLALTISTFYLDSALLTPPDAADDDDVF